MTHQSISDKVKIKSKKKRSHSSRMWLQRQLNDPFVKQAQIDGYRSRAAYKLREMAKKFKLFDKADVIVDLGAAPGGWLQIAKSIKPKAFVVGVDLQDYEDVTGTIKIVGDITDETTLNILAQTLEGRKADVILSDMAAASCGIASVDHDRIMGLLEMTFDFALDHLN
ncbi:MAG: RlmE family RNA methyltransferase, partial [Alphaproteobacteria bacterium]|nr:RlmE family RNA methyltransferase [Alphaproteobacteria bacterium]